MFELTRFVSGKWIEVKYLLSGQYSDKKNIELVPTVCVCL